MHNGINKKVLGLLEIKNHIWQNIIWVNINGNAPNFEEHMSVAISRWSEFNQKQNHGGKDSKFKLVSLTEVKKVNKKISGIKICSNTEEAFKKTISATRKLVKTQQTWMKKFDISLTKSLSPFRFSKV